MFSHPAFLTASNTPEAINSPAHLVALGYRAALLSAALLADLDSHAGLSTAQCAVASECLAHTASLTLHAHPGDPAMYVAFSSMATSVAFSSQGAVAILHSTAVPEYVLAGTPIGNPRKLRKVYFLIFISLHGQKSWSCECL